MCQSSGWEIQGFEIHTEKIAPIDQKSTSTKERSVYRSVPSNDNTLVTPNARRVPPKQTVLQQPRLQVVAQENFERSTSWCSTKGQIKDILIDIIVVCHTHKLLWGAGGVPRGLMQWQQSNLIRGLVGLVGIIELTSAIFYL